MANRSKKVVLSARIEASIKAGLELAAAAQSEKIVAFLEYCIKSGLTMLAVSNPFSPDKDSKIPFNIFFDCIWSDDEVLYKLRAGALGPDHAGVEMIELALIVTTNSYFKGEFDLYGDLNGAVKSLGYVAPKVLIDLEKVRREWDVITEYAGFKQKNPTLNIPYERYLELAYQKDIPL